MAFPTLAQLNWVCDDNLLGQRPLMGIDTVQLQPYGRRVRGYDFGSLHYGEGIFIYMQGVASNAQGALATINEVTGVVVLTVAASRGPIGVSLSTATATQWGWYQIAGSAVVSAATATINQGLIVTATAGQAAVVAAGLTQIYGATSLTALNTPSTGFVQAGINYPAVLGYTSSAVG